MPYAAVFETHMVTDCEALSGSGVKEHNAPDLLYQQMSLALIFHVGEPLRAFWNQAQSRLCRMLLHIRMLRQTPAHQTQGGDYRVEMKWIISINSDMQHKAYRTFTSFHSICAN